MTVDVCPILYWEQDSEPCPDCPVRKAAPKRPRRDRIINHCLAAIRQGIEDVLDRPGNIQLIFLGLGKLRRLTATEEEPMVDITQKKEVMNILSLVEKHNLSLDDNLILQLQMDIGVILFNIGEYDAALTRFFSLAKNNPEEKKLWNNMGVMMARLKRDGEALEYYDKAIALEPSYGTAWFNKGKALVRSGQKKKALECFRKATQYSPENKSAWNNLGVTLRQMKKFREAIKCYDLALEIHSKYPWAWHNKGVALMELKRYKQAMQCFDRALQIDPNYEPAKHSKKELMRKLM